LRRYIAGSPRAIVAHGQRPGRGGIPRPWDVRCEGAALRRHEERMMKKSYFLWSVMVLAMGLFAGCGDDGSGGTGGDGDGGTGGGPGGGSVVGSCLIEEGARCMDFVGASWTKSVAQATCDPDEDLVIYSDDPCDTEGAVLLCEHPGGAEGLEFNVYFFEAEMASEACA